MHSLGWDCEILSVGDDWVSVIIAAISVLGIIQIVSIVFVFAPYTVCYYRSNETMTMCLMIWSLYHTRRLHMLQYTK